VQAGVVLDERTKGAFVDENFQTSVEGIFAAGNVLHVHDLVDYVSLEGEKTADAVARYLQSGLNDCEISIRTDRNIGHIIPQKISGKVDFRLCLRVNRPFKNCVVTVEQAGEIIAESRLGRVLPAEMIEIPIKCAKIAQKKDLEVQVH
jgi:hypothetical protein